MDKGMTKPEYKAFMKLACVATARREIVLTQANVRSELARNGVVSDRTADAADKAVAILAKLTA